MQEVDNTQATQLLTSEELRTQAISKSQQRGKWVSRRRIARRWVLWLLWHWTLPVVGLVTVFMAVATLSLVYYHGPETAIDATQTWLSDQFGIAPKTTPAVKEEMQQHHVVPTVLTENAAGIAGAGQDLKPSLAIDLQLERSISVQNLLKLAPDQTATFTNNKSDQQLPKGNQP